MSLSSAVIDADSKDHLFLVILVVSCLLHGLAIMAIAALKLEKRSSHSSEKEKISVTLAPDHHPDVYLSLDATVFDTTATDIIQSPLSEGISHSKKGTSPLDNSAKKKRSAMRRTGGVPYNRKEAQSNTQKSLDITYKLEEDTFWQKEQGASATGGVTTNGATIVSGKLFKKVQEAQRHSSYTPRADGEVDASSLTSGGGSRIIKIRDRCFILTEASPLDQLGAETWARTKCKY